MAGLVVALALIPEAIAFSIIAGVDPKVGLYASFSIAVLTALTLTFGWDVRTVGDMGALPDTLPVFLIPQIPLTLETLWIIRLQLRFACHVFSFFNGRSTGPLRRACHGWQAR